MPITIQIDANMLATVERDSLLVISVTPSIFISLLAILEEPLALHTA
jgi:hypothetical protein